MRMDGTEIHNTTIEGDLMRFTVPPVAPGSYELSLDPWGYVSCDPHASLAISSTFAIFAAHHAITIVPWTGRASGTAVGLIGAERWPRGRSELPAAQSWGYGLWHLS
jgi:hypothetical protein